MRWTIATLVALLVTGTVGVVTAQETITVRVEGMGADPDGALKNAFTRAIQEAVGTFVDAEAIVSNDKLQEEILTYSDGVVTRFTVVKEATRDMNLGGLFRVEIDAVVETKELSRRLEASGVLSSTVSGEDQWARLVSQVKNVKDGRKLLKKFFDTHPQHYLMVAHPMDDQGRKGSDKQFAQAYDPKTGKVTLAINLEVFIDAEAFYTQYAPKLVAILEAISGERGEGTTRGSGTYNISAITGRKGLDLDWPSGDPGAGKIRVRVPIGRDSSGVNTRFRWFDLQENEYSDLIENEGNQPIRMTVTLVNQEGKVLKRIEQTLKPSAENGWEYSGSLRYIDHLLKMKGKTSGEAPALANCERKRMGFSTPVVWESYSNTAKWYTRMQDWNGDLFDSITTRLLVQLSEDEVRQLDRIHVAFSPLKKKR